jgi:pimeloyl-ACP methyl ester carboxylesterase
MPQPAPFGPEVLPQGIRSRFVEGINGGLRMHVLEAGHETPGRPALLLLHGFPELAYSWRKVMVPLAEAGYHVIAPDQRGYGRTTGWSADYDGDLAPFRMLNLVRDAMGLLAALGHRQVAAVVGHDFGSPVAAWASLIRPDIFRAVALMSAPFAGPPPLPEGQPAKPAVPDIHAAMLARPRPRKHYQWYYSTEAANAEMWHPPEGVEKFLRAYFHMKSADWRLPDGSPANRPHRLAGWIADALAEMPTYYIMDAACGMAETVAPHMPSAEHEAACRWLSPRDLKIYAEEYGRTGFQGGLHWYRCQTSGQFAAEMSLFHGRAIEVPALFIAGEADWGIFQFPGALEAMQEKAFARMQAVHVVPGAGHWVQQEQPEAVVRLVLGFLGGLRSG